MSRAEGGGTPEILRVRRAELLAALAGDDAALRAWAVVLAERPSGTILDPARVRALWNDGLSLTRMMAVLRCGKGALERLLKRLDLRRGRGWKPPGFRPGRVSTIDRAQLAAMAAERRSLSEMGIVLGVLPATVWKALRRWEIPYQHRERGIPIDAARLRALWDRPVAEIAAELRCNPASVWRAGRRLGLKRPPRPPKPPRVKTTRPPRAERIKAERPQPARVEAARPRAPEPPRPPPGPPAPPRSADQAAIAAFIATRGVTRCPTTAVLPTQAPLSAADGAALRQRAAERDAAAHGEHVARATRSAWNREKNRALRGGQAGP